MFTMVTFVPHNAAKVLSCTLFLLLCVWVNSQAAIAAPTVVVEIGGVEARLKDNIQLFLSIEQQKTYPGMTEARIRRLHKKAVTDIRSALEPFGYYRAEIQARLIRESENTWRAVYYVNPGPPIRIEKLDLQLSGEALTDHQFQVLIENAPLKPGNILDHTIYNDFKSDLAKLAALRGYFDARFTTHRIEVDLEKYSATIILHYATGIRYRFGSVTLHQDILRPQFLDRYVPFEAGEYYSVERMIELQQALNDSDYFREVEVQALFDQAEGDSVPVEAKLTPRKRHRYTFGLGYGTDTGARGKLGWEMPRVNRRGHRFDTFLRASQIGESIELRYRVPVFNPRTDQIIYSGGITNERTDTSDSSVRTLATSLIHTRAAWRETVSLSYQQERYDIGIESGRSVLLMPGVSWSRVWADDRIYTNRGLSLGLDLRGATDQFVSDTTFSQAQGSAKAVYALNHFGRVLLRGRAGTTIMQKFTQLPASVRYFTGGADSVRGFAYRSLGPTNERGEVVGGKYLLVGSAEYEQRVGEKWGLAVFYDTGNAIDSFVDPLETGGGFGFRWKSPVGPVRLDFARAFSHPNKPWRIHINIGPDL